MFSKLVIAAIITTSFTSLANAFTSQTNSEIKL